MNKRQDITREAVEVAVNGLVASVGFVVMLVVGIFLVSM